MVHSYFDTKKKDATMSGDVLLGPWVITENEMLERCQAEMNRMWRKFGILPKPTMGDVLETFGATHLTPINVRAHDLTEPRS